jgi:hypothetical protein
MTLSAEMWLFDPSGHKPLWFLVFTLQVYESKGLNRKMSLHNKALSEVGIYTGAKCILRFGGSGFHERSGKSGLFNAWPLAVQIRPITASD